MMNISGDKLKLRRVAASFFVALSLFVSSISACICADHSRQIELNEHCQPTTTQKSSSAENNSHHSHGEFVEDKNVENDGHDYTSHEIDLSIFASNGECCCLDAAPKTFGKFEKYKTGKQTARLLPSARIEVNSTWRVIRVHETEFATPFYLFDSFHNVPRGRAPPRL